MNKLSPKKRTELLKLGVGTVGLLAILHYALIRPQYVALQQKALEIVAVQEKVKVAKHEADLADRIKGDWEAAEAKLESVEATFPSGDFYFWIVKTLARFQASHRIHFNQVDPPQVAPLEVPPKVPYEVAKFTVGGRASYHDFGVFLANFENSFPYMRIQRLELEPSSYAKSNSEEDEKLLFSLELTILIKPPPAKL
ncbi:MAG: hypothetical protein HY674_19945 [Chloroflexi bacterium]|nr:hypothetical protein [Chloroflexota bacterium]